MSKLIKFLLIAQLKRPKSAGKNAGFTLIEIIVAMVLAVIVLIPLLGFAINILDTDRREQAKSTSDQEIQAALDYIRQDLQQAVYIYDAEGLNKIKDKLLPAPTDKSSRVPVLVFWKRDIKPKIEPVGPVGTVDCSKTPEKCNDAFVYSLVTYYLIDSSGSNQSTWAKNAYQIGRFQLIGGVADPSYNGKAGKPYYQNADPDPAYEPFDLSGSNSLAQKMNAWKSDSSKFKNPKSSYAATQFPSILIDYVDKTPASQNASLTPSECIKTLNNPKDAEEKAIPADQLQVPAYSGDNAYINDSFKTSSFYACVDSGRNIAKVFIRGNAKARLNPGDVNYNANAAAYFPIASVQVQGRGSLSNKQ